MLATARKLKHFILFKGLTKNFGSVRPNHFFVFILFRFVCQCCAEVRNLGKINPYGASTLPKTQLSEHIEGKVNAYLRSQIIGDPIGEVTIRVVVSVEKEMKIKNNLLEKIDSTNNSYPYQ